MPRGPSCRRCKFAALLKYALVVIFIPSTLKYRKGRSNYAEPTALNFRPTAAGES
jgi:hypothetical protein